jgi:hypothetical protein
MDQNPELPPDQPSQPPASPPSLPPVLGQPNPNVPPMFDSADTLGHGFGIGALWNVVALVACGLTLFIGVGAIAVAIGVIQLAWIIPLTRKHKRLGRPETVKGIWLAAGITFLLNAACWGALMFGLSGANFH